jgi:hypothetical protein
MALECLALGLEPRHVPQIDVATLGTTPVMAEGAARAVVVVAEGEDPFVDPCGKWRAVRDRCGSARVAKIVRVGPIAFVALNLLEGTPEAHR